MSLTIKQICLVGAVLVAGGAIVVGTHSLPSGKKIADAQAHAVADSANTTVVVTSDAEVDPSPGLGSVSANVEAQAQVAAKSEKSFTVYVTIDGIKVPYTFTASTAMTDDKMIDDACRWVGSYRAKGIKAFIAGADKTTVLGAVVDEGEGPEVLALQRDAAGKGWNLANMASMDTAHPQAMQRLQNTDEDTLAGQLAASCVERNT